jgi:hypothetical protein
MAILELGDYVGTASRFGEEVRHELVEEGRLRPVYRAAIAQLVGVSAAGSDADLMIKVISRIASNQLFLKQAWARYGNT